MKISAAKARALGIVPGSPRKRPEPQGRYPGFPSLCELHGLPRPQPEYPFAKGIGRRWRMDFCWVAEKLFLEVQGSIFTQGRHTRGASLLKEFEKLNAASAMGYRPLFCTPKDVNSGAVIETIRRALEVAS